ncbi:cation:proton antiporter [Deinococcus soli (ex Cha et al. 2016)]|uniref:Kef-type K+ transport system membrane component KefB n=2 Tax=Deinococcus soli (ex Cha et al. 2016) TaxID=1309411 RepID=A0ACC6KBW3_9DEIO|nr:cation:proton antiporter [Deinococcus soli (ex Cha et al. 2016)]MDR6216937.1 Kef-type K+ transport system membrane component KefB [Deinococcus soli (ex Cha et al. 2016)]MDR6327758.1 Kef-type K+ transport system membrane component KefB [Deinococcus soli (ex Cha et al. 2016)]MDR6750033.1 Kef-type K+ transport system membrane component KefB [Deinococcus soli (ex Cha et al. 2016)]
MVVFKGLGWRSALPLGVLLSGGALAASSAGTADLLFGLFWVVLAAAVFGAVASKLGVPAVVGQVLAGILIGPSVLRLVRPDDFLLSLAELGAVFLLFMVGLETRFRDLLSVGKEALLVAVLGIAFPLALGFGFGLWQDQGNVSALFVGTALVATSVGITAKVLQEMGVLDARFAQVILGAAVIDDILGLTLLAVVSGLGAGESMSAAQVALILGLSVGFVALVLAVGIPLVRRFQPRLRNLSLSRMFNVAIVVGLGVAALSTVAGLAPIIGAFLAGMVLAEVKDEVEFESKVHALESFLAPVFFVVVGLQLDLGVLGDPVVIVAGLILTVLAVIGKVAGGLIGARSMGRRQSLLVGVGMVPRGEVGLIVASLGLAAGVIGKQVYAEVLLMVLLTTVLAPLVLRALAPRPERDAPAA